MKTTTAQPMASTDRKWYLVDAEGQTLGRLATKIAEVLNGKGKPLFNHHVDSGDYVVVINADKFKVSGNKLAAKNYYRHSGYLGHLRATPLEDKLVKDPIFPLKNAVSGMLPKNKLRKDKLLRLKLYTGAEHPHEAQQLENLHV